MARTKRSRAVLYHSIHWTSVQRRAGCVAPTTWAQEVQCGSKAANVYNSTQFATCGSSALEDALRQLPAEARLQLVDYLTAGGDAGSGKQADLCAARLGCKVLREVIDDGLRSLRFNVLPNKVQGPAPSLSRFPNVRSLTLSIDATWDSPLANAYGHPAPGEQPAPRLDFCSDTHAYPPALLLEPLQGQPPASLRRIRSLTLLGQLTSFMSLCDQLHGVFGSAAGEPAGCTGCSDVAAPPRGSPGAPLCDARGPSDSRGVAGTCPIAGAGAVVAGDATRCCSLVHLHLGNACFPKASVTTWDLTWGHGALAALGVRELTLGVELLRGLETHQVAYSSPVAAPHVVGARPRKVPQ